MSKKTVAPQPAPTQGAIPLSDITITWYRQPHFHGEKGAVPIMITGRQLGQVLSWLAQTRPACWAREPARPMCGRRARLA